MDAVLKTRSSRIAVAVAALVSFLPLHQALADDGWYVGVGYAVVSLDGDFDGESVITAAGTVDSAGDSTEIVPEFDPTGGFALLGGLEQGRLACEFGIAQVDLDGTWLDVDGTGEFTTYTVDVKYIFRDAKRFRPMIIGGLGVRRLDVIDGSFNDTEVQDAKFRGGVDWRLGVGAYISFGRGFGVDLQAIYRFSDFSEVDGIVEGDLTEDLDADGVTVLAAFKYSFGGN